MIHHNKKNLTDSLDRKRRMRESSKSWTKKSHRKIKKLKNRKDQKKFKETKQKFVACYYQTSKSFMIIKGGLIPVIIP